MPGYTNYLGSGRQASPVLAGRQHTPATVTSEPPRTPTPPEARKENKAPVTPKTAEAPAWNSSPRDATPKAAETPSKPAGRKNDTYRSHTSWFRDEKCWSWLENEGLFRAACRAAAENRDVRVWSCGCSTGEELYSLALLYERRVKPALARGLGRRPPRLALCGTDMREENVAKAADGDRRWTAAALRTAPFDVMKEDFVAARAPSASRSPRHLSRQWRLRDPQFIADIALRTEDVAGFSGGDDALYRGRVCISCLASRGGNSSTSVK